MKIRAQHSSYKRSLFSFFFFFFSFFFLNTLQSDNDSNRVYGFLFVGAGQNLGTIQKKLKDRIFFFSALKDLNGSVALSKVQIKCGICSKSYACRHTDRTFNGKVSYFKASK